MDWLQKVGTGVQTEAIIIETTSNHDIKADYDDGTDAHAEMSVYFIKATDLIKIICNGKIPPAFSFRLKHDFCLFTYDPKKRAFEPLLTPPEDVDRDTLFIRYDNCFRFMHLWLEQMLLWRKKAKLPIPQSVHQTRRDLDATGDAESLLNHIIKLEAACRDASNMDHPHESERTAAQYEKDARMTSHFLFELGLRYKTLKRSVHKLAGLKRFPFASFVFEGFLLLNQDVWETMRRPFIQMHVILPRFNDLVLQQQLDDIPSLKKKDTAAMLQNAEAVAESKAAALILAERHEAEEVVRKQEAKKAKRARQKERKVRFVDTVIRPQGDMTLPPPALTLSNLRPDAPEFVPQTVH